MLLLLPAVMWLFFNATVNRHTHFLADGIVITHAHPFAATQSGLDTSQMHHHTKRELLLLSFFSVLTTTILMLLFLKPFLFALPQIIRIHNKHPEPVREYFQVNNYHAPPSPRSIS